jgi:hypothetical protein
MIKLFRKIRYDLMEKNKTGKYFKYAVGEIALVVIGILIALSINNWNESRKLENKKQELVLNLIEDFEENIILLKSEIDYSGSLKFKMDGFFENGYSNNLKISLDSLKNLSDGFFRPTDFFPIMTSYDEAKANGNITLLKNKELSQEFTEFQKNFNFYLGLQDQVKNSFFNGSVWELKKSLGSLSFITGRKRSYIHDHLNMDEYLEVINTPLVTAVLENQSTLNYNINDALKRMDINSDNILESLKLLKK